MKKFLLLICVLVFIFASCIGKNRHSIARIKEKYACNIDIVNNSSYKLHYKYAPVPERNDYDNLPFTSNIALTIAKLEKLDFVVNSRLPHYFNVYGTVASKEEKRLYSGIDAGPCSFIEPMDWANSNLDGLPSRFVIVIDGETTCYSLVADCAEKNSNTTVEITNETIERLKTFKDEEFEIGYNGKREWYGKSVKIQNGLYCFSRYDFKKNPLVDYSYIEGMTKLLTNEELLHQALYARIPCHYDSTGLYIRIERENYVIIFYNDDDQKFYYVKSDASVNPVD